MFVSYTVNDYRLIFLFVGYIALTFLPLFNKEPS